MKTRLTLYSEKNIMYLAWLISLCFLVASLYFSDIKHLVPCKLCWAQRVFMYPLVLIIPIGLQRRDQELPYYIMTLSVVGLVTALYHNLLYYHILSEKWAPCSVGASCTDWQITWFGFVGIPLLSLLAFLFMTGSMIYVFLKRKER